MDSPLRYVTDVPYIAGFTAEISPQWLDLVAVVTAGLYADAIHGLLPLIIFNRYVLGAVVSDS